MSEAVKKEYRKRGLSYKDAAPKGGKGIHTLRAHKAVARYLSQGLSRNEAWKRVVGGMGKHAIKKSHRRTTA